ncbi:SAC3/GANP/Nin1/mts3/eIF-3 p25 family-domain-containing protein [Mycotypha africana]|uniref:SAC3/GANP/Nin1/mts3/eIF-3 p25 family-domain-containing protein n=1 Tax=Mycotypha africana TaxID=64632 RepID=UPI00230015E2|nr:SAC3/GANP/Nin1/mts3/eIF-3 p25 family-domain-containing protein [Mycotypha africana]KAI8975109.1 SAC3/GANP/Nin1/mts3/eIF-3 p25 family-domain-containing protein [Mycotypha africana]
MNSNNKQTQYIVVKSGNNKKSKAVKAIKDSMDIDKAEENWPSSLNEYVAHAFAHCPVEKKALLENQLKSIIKQAQRTNMLDIIDWNERDLPTACSTQQNPNSSRLFHKPTKQKQLQTQPNQQTLTSKMGNIELTPAEIRKRELRALRFQQDTKKTSAPSPPAPSTPTLGTVTAPKPVAAKVPGAKGKKQRLITPIVWETETAPPSNQIIVGTSTELEKPYFRLTSAADPATVRPLPVLRKAFKFLLKKWREEENYSYICEQFKSMRQDLTVQRIRNDFTVQVYEAHARIALEKGDLGEYNQCQTQLKYLYEQDIPGSNEEFLAYRILYMLFSQNESDINSMLEEKARMGLEEQSDCVQHALMVRSALAKGNYYQFFKLYKSAPNMGGYLLDQFVDRKRIEALIVICKAYQKGIPFTFLSNQLAFNSLKKFRQFLRNHGLHVTKKMPTFDTKGALPVLLAHKDNYSRVDIKGQI